MNNWWNKACVWLGSWMVINLLQSLATPLADDEAYYWIFSLHPDWGYFNHPPFVGWMIAFFRTFLEGALAVRLPSVLLSTAGIWLVYRTVKPQKTALFFLILSSMVIAHVLGFVTTPDVPLFFFTALYFYLLAQYLQKDHWSLALGLGLTVALMGYSKYQGILVVVFSLLPLIFLLRRWGFWMAILVAAIAFFPHFYWQYSHDFATFRFHLMERMPEAWKWHFPLDYLGGQLLVFGPFVSIPVLWAVFKSKRKNLLQQSAFWTVTGSLVFFFFMSFKGRTEANWTSFLIAPLMVCCQEFFETRPTWQKWIKRLGAISLLSVVAVRLILAYNLIPALKTPFEDKTDWAQTVAAKAGDRPVVFYSSYQPVSNYMFQTGNDGFLISMDRNSGSQFVMWPEWEMSLQGKEVLNICNGWVHCPDSMLIEGRKQAYRLVDNWRSYNYLKIDAHDLPEKMNRRDSLEVELTLTNSGAEAAALTGTEGEPLLLTTGVYENNNPVVYFRKPLVIQRLGPHEKITLKTYIRTPKSPGDYRLSFAIEVPGLHIGKNCRFYHLSVE